jgi:sulfatase maturation enzyme AslB (radical SAM superfamily)
MEAVSTLRKIIDGTQYSYHKRVDTIYRDILSCGSRYDRTQVEKPVDICVELTTFCNFTCRNCFSDSAKGQTGHHVDAEAVMDYLTSHRDEFIRISFTGGEPMLHPTISSLLRLPEHIQDCAFVITTNGVIRRDLDDILIGNEWLVAISLHGNKSTHDRYSVSYSHEKVVNRIASLAPETVVHIYSVLHDAMRTDDIEFLFKLRDESGAAFLRFIEPRPHGRFEPLTNETLIREVERRLDERSGLKSTSSLTRFITAAGDLRLSA